MPDISTWDQEWRFFSSGGFAIAVLFRYFEYSCTSKQGISGSVLESTRPPTYSGVHSENSGLNIYLYSWLRFIIVTQQVCSAESVRGKDVKWRPEQPVCRLPEHPLALPQRVTQSTSSLQHSKCIHIGAIFLFRGAHLRLKSLGILLRAGHVLEAG